MAAGLDYLMGGPDHPKELLMHLGKTYRYINQNIQRSHPSSVSTIVTVMSMAIHEDFFGRPKITKVHMDALSKLLIMKGGFEHLIEINCCCKRFIGKCLLLL
jgi:hypothetical protein